MRRAAVGAFGALAVAVLAGGAVLMPGRGDAALQKAGFGGQVIIGRDDDNTNNALIQPAGVAANQSMDNTDVLRGSFGNDVLIGLLGSDVMLGSFGNDILVGGAEQGSRPNSDVMFGDEGDDISLWAGGDGSEAFIGGQGFRDALIFGTIDRDANNVPTLSPPVFGFPGGVPTANVSGQGGFCTIERVPQSSLGYEFLVRFFVRSTGNLAVTVRTAEVEQVFCTSREGGKIVFADLRRSNPQFVEVTLDQVRFLNPDAARIMR
jgi:hypothetical protein